jgi:hypothetical protein
MKIQNFKFYPISFTLFLPLLAHATQFEPKETAIAAALGTTKAFKKKFSLDGKDYDLFYSKDAAGNPLKFASVQTGIYAPDCTHTWVMGLDAKTKKIEKIHVVEMKCPHAFPAKSESFLSQYDGKGPADLKTLDSSVTTIAKATGSAVLTTDAVKRSIRLAEMFK